LKLNKRTERKILKLKLKTMTIQNWN